MTALPPAGRRERFAWCMYDFANSGYTTVVLTAVFNAYFVGVVAGGGEHDGSATLLWTIAMAAANGLVLLCAPVLGAIADHSAAKKRFLIASTIGCILFTSLLSTVGPGDIAAGMVLVILATVMFSAGENFIAAFLPEIAPPEHMGRLSGYGWTIGYVGGLLTLGLCVAYIQWAEAQGQTAQQYVPTTNLIVAVVFLLAALPTLIWLQERAVAAEPYSLKGYIGVGFQRLHHTLRHARQHRDLFRFLLCLTIYGAGINTVVVLAAVYAQQVMGFTTRDTLMLIMVVNVTAAVGAFAFGHVQDRIGSRTTLMLTLIIWIIAIGIAYAGTSVASFWLAANLIGVSLGASQSAGRALVGLFSPPQRSGEFFGLWGLAMRLAAIIGPLTYGAAIYLLQGNHRLAILSTLLFFIAGLALLLTVNERRGRQAALQDHWNG
jgi:UMF1 family MFS transporter